MDALHRQEGKECRGCQYRKHISKVGGGRHFDILNHIGIGFAALNDTLLQYHQVFFQQDNICRLFCNIYCSVHGNANIRRFHRRSVIDAIPHKAYGMAAAPQGRHNTCLLIRRELGKYIRRFCHLDQLVIAHAFHIGAEQKIAYLEAHLLADTAGHTVVISGEDFCGDAMGFQCPNRLRGSRNARYPIRTISHSSLTLYVSAAGSARFCAMAITRIPSSFKSATVFRIACRI